MTRHTEKRDEQQQVDYGSPVTLHKSISYPNNPTILQEATISYTYVGKIILPGSSGLKKQNQSAPSRPPENKT
ncbi:MAG: hypothetical protein HGA97_09755 [Chlorobiaceae bacterium]|nr:hypothetical protein [Chlorobiaceae bacterium]